MKCNRKLIIDKLAGELSARQTAKLDRHLAACAACRREYEALSKVWQLTAATLEKDSFAAEISPARRAEIFAAASHEEKCRRRNRIIRRLLEYAVVLAIGIVLAGILLPPLKPARKKVRQLAMPGRIKSDLSVKEVNRLEERSQARVSSWKRSCDQIGREEREKKSAPALGATTVLPASAPAPASEMNFKHLRNSLPVKDKKSESLLQVSKTPEPAEKPAGKVSSDETPAADSDPGLNFVSCPAQPLSTFSIDTDNASYIQARQSIRRGNRPEPLKIRPEEFINYFNYHYRPPANAVFAVYPEAAPAPFRPQNILFRIGIQGKRLGPNAGRRAHYTLLLDTSGSMAVKDRMELARKILMNLFKKLNSSDRIALLLCGDRTVPVFSLRPLTPDNRKRLLNLAAQTTPHGTAAFADGIIAAYAYADNHYLPNGSNRVIIISDGIFELDDAGRRNIAARLEAARKRGISNLVIGLGGDGDDKLLEKVAALGDGSYVFIDTEREADELFANEFEARFREIARDVKIQLEFNSAAVAFYRQIGYQNRQLRTADFRNDKVDAGEVGSGQAVTALYELKLKDGVPKHTVVATIRIRYKKAEDMSVEEKVFYLSAGEIKAKFDAADPAFRLAALVAEFAEALRYPEASGIASPRGIADKLRALWLSDYRRDNQVTELLTLIRRIK
ncbi:MAG: von Willebrand factor type A domain-containing protein [Victivallaceae bacterium]|nr:von Willebrand factor type A domain-containing protein [Victivallaceae bacterium]